MSDKPFLWRNIMDNLSRRQLIKYAGLAGVSMYGSNLVAGDFYKGVTIRVLTQAGTDYEPYFRKMGKTFQILTGAKVEFEFAPWEGLMPKVQADLASGVPQFDLFCNDIEFQYTIWPHLEPINDFIESGSYEMEGFLDPVYKYGEGIAGNKGVRYGLPIVTGVSVLFYRKDLMNKFPTTWEDYENLLKKHTDGNMHGVSMAGVPAQLVKAFLARYWRLGKPLMTRNWKPLINGKEGLEAITTLKRHITKYAPPGTLAWDNPDAANAFLAGDVAVHEGWAGFILPSLDDPNKSKVVNKWGIAPYPQGGTGNFVQHNFAMMKTSKNKKAAFDLMAFMTNPKNMKLATLEFGITPSRETLYNDSDVLRKKPYMDDYVKVLKRGKPFTPGVPQWLEMFIGVAETCSQVVSNEAEPKEALDELADKWSELLEQNPLNFEYEG